MDEVTMEAKTLQDYSNIINKKEDDLEFLTILETDLVI